MAEPLAPEGEGPEEEDLDEPIEVAGVPLAVWAVRLSIFLFIQGAIVLASYAYYGFGTDPSHFGPSFRLDPLHAVSNLIWGLAGSVIGFFVPRFAIDFLLAFAFFFTAIAALGSFAPESFGLQLGPWTGLAYWLLALFAWAVAIYAIWQGCVDSQPET
jgi:hypothetical protein